MGANYHLYQKPCEHCNRSDEPLHIGKSSFGWVFQLRIYPEKGINSFEDWLKHFYNPENTIRNENGAAIRPCEMIETIMLPHADVNRLCRSDLKHCVRHGPRWDLNEKEFC